MLRCILLLAYFEGALGRFMSTYNCEDIEKELTEPVTLDQIVGTWYLVERAEPAEQNVCLKLTIKSEKGADGKLNPQQKYTWSDPTDSAIWEGIITQDNTATCRFKTNYEYLSFWMVKTGVDFTKHIIMLTCRDKLFGASNIDRTKKSDVHISMMSRTKTLSKEETKIVQKKLKTIADLGTAKFKSMCSNTLSAMLSYIQYT